MAAQQLAQHGVHQQWLLQLQDQNNNRGPRATTLATIPNYSGDPTNDLADWEATLNRAAVVDEWDQAMLRRVAISKLTGPALTWQNQTGHAVGLWNDWIVALRAMFHPQLSIAEWVLKVESKRQLPGESGAQYAMDKVKICRLCPIVLAEQDMIPYLIRGLHRPEQAAAMMGNVPLTIELFVNRIRVLEQIGYQSTTGSFPSLTSGGSVSVVVPAAVPPIPEETSAQIITLVTQMTALTAAVQGLATRPRPSWNPSPNAGFRAAGAATSFSPGAGSFRPATPSPFRSATPTNTQVGAGRGQPFVPRTNPPYVPRPRTPLNELQCWTCGYFGHLQRDCPSQTSASSFFSGNEEADLQGQGWPNEQ